MSCIFPFGCKIKRIQQINRTPKKAFILGVYASAVHARWIDSNGKTKVTALAVTSEPEIFWRGENADEIIAEITIPEELGKLTVPTKPELNGPSGRSLDRDFLSPLQLSRDEVWLCDLLPESRLNENQQKALAKHYTDEVIIKYGLPRPTIPNFDPKELASPQWRFEILQELEKSQAETIILLGDLPIYHLLRFYQPYYSCLSDFGDDLTQYGQPRDLEINGKVYSVIALCHPRQAGKLGTYSTKWSTLHAQWKDRMEGVVAK